jgi:HPt (histidine-containing phosphotransfer) domain-containing protein
LSEESLSEIPIIAMTAHARREDRRKCIAAGMDAYISKPLDAGKLIELVETVKRRPDGHQSSDSWDSPPVKPLSELPSPLLNLQAARARMNHNEELVKDLAKFFLEDAPEFVVQIEQAIQKSHFDIIERAAHNLKGLAANFDAETLIMAAIGMEDAGRQGDVKNAQQHFPELRRAVRDVCTAFQNYIGTNEES